MIVQKYIVEGYNEVRGIRDYLNGISEVIPGKYTDNAIRVGAIFTSVISLEIKAYHIGDSTLVAKLSGYPVQDHSELIFTAQKSRQINEAKSFLEREAKTKIS